MQQAAPVAADDLLTQALASLAAGDLHGAGVAYQQARSAAPKSAELPHRMGLALAEAGRAQEALVQHFVAERLAPGEARYRRTLAAALAGANLAKGSPAIVESLCRLLAAPDIGPHDVAPAAWTLVDARPAVRHLWLALEHPDFARVEACMLEPAVQQELAQPLLQLLLARAQVLTPEHETALAALRAFALRVLPQPRLAWLIAEGPEPLAALALQADLAGHAWPETAPEEAALSTLSPRIAHRGATAQEMLLHACYRGWPEALAWPAGLPESPILAEAHRRLSEEPAERRGLAAALPALTPRAEDSERPTGPTTPWLATTLPQPRPLAEALRGLFPDLTLAPPPEPLSLLIAGCGTGEQAIAAASRFTGAEALATDTSRAALAYAQQRAQAMGVRQIAFAAADPLALGSLERRFGLIACELHRVADPAATWRALRGLLAPRGLMHIGLQSRLGRRALMPVQQRAGTGPGRPADAAALRRLRHWLIAHRDQPEAALVLSLREAWQLDELRTLLFPIGRRRTSLPEIAGLLDELDLRFLGFEFRDPRTPALFRSEHPQVGAERDLALWQAFEEARPATFTAGYRFWCRAQDR